MWWEGGPLQAPGPRHGSRPGALGNMCAHQFAPRAPLPGFDHELQEVNIQDTDIICSRGQETFLLPPHTQPTRHQGENQGLSGCSPRERVHVRACAENRPLGEGGRGLLCVWPGPRVPQRGGSPARALPTSPQIQGLRLTLVGQVQG